MMTCVNRNCGTPMGSLSDGRLFHFEILSISVAANDDHKTDRDEIPSRDTVQFWLCGKCTETMTLAMKPIGGLHLLPSHEASENRMGPPEKFHEPLGLVS